MFDCEDDPWWLEYMVFLLPLVLLCVFTLASLTLPGNFLRAKVIRKNEPVKIQIIKPEAGE